MIPILVYNNFISSMRQKGSDTSFTNFELKSSTLN